VVTEKTHFRRRVEHGGLRTERVKRLEELELENIQLRGAISDLTPDKLITAGSGQGKGNGRPVVDFSISAESKADL
jgi:putative transposase